MSLYGIKRSLDEVIMKRHDQKRKYALPLLCFSLRKNIIFTIWKMLFFSFIRIFCAVCSTSIVKTSPAVPFFEINYLYEWADLLAWPLWTDGRGETRVGFERRGEKESEGLNAVESDGFFLHLMWTAVCTLISTFIYIKDANVAFTGKLICMEEACVCMCTTLSGSSVH